MADGQPQSPANPNSGTTRVGENYLKSSDYFMAVACLAAKRSKDPSRQVGACIVNQEGKIVGIGHNRMPNGCDGELPWSQQGEWLDQKYPYVCHAELNAMMNKNSADVKGCTMYVTLFPCNECAKLIIQAGIKDVVYLSDAHHTKDWTKASKRMLDLAGIPYTKFDSERTEIVINFKSFDHAPHDTVAHSSENVSAERGEEAEED